MSGAYLGVPLRLNPATINSTKGILKGLYNLIFCLMVLCIFQTTRDKHLEAH